MSKFIVYGGTGALGSTLVESLIASNHKVLSIDLTNSPHTKYNLIMAFDEPLQSQYDIAFTQIKEFAGSDKIKGIFCVAGGWAGGNASDEGFLESVEKMWKQSVASSAIAAKIASSFLQEDGLLVFTGASAAKNGTPGMIGYGMAKSAVHNLVQSLSCPSSGLPKNSKVIAILPITLDTPTNRKAMSDADFSSWTPLSEVASFLIKASLNQTSVQNGHSLGVDSITLDTPANRKAMPDADFSSWTPLSEVARFLIKASLSQTSFQNGQLVEIQTIAGKTTFK
ncbi:Short-chain dehydrogenase/reductase domain-containing protein [Rozella allomycis CSF55]|uniref:Dihydropteridine reductase n=1 Tax=Rozella allomycis (strain CSF55) TaxID=988480 RepID=A0A075APY4_ROZAC|nr:Short-chain dehydrogenase/reductase domain-containing protein [Rozella allomycis CSF55]|eukprot:EPZ30795.1 Short-chain dehydrogenase/reductase domain-containing protein [Rozella allomycis CSF55]